MAGSWAPPVAHRTPWLQRRNIGRAQRRNNYRTNCGCRCGDRIAPPAAEAPSRRNRCSFARKPRRAPIHCPAPKPSRCRPDASNARSDRSPNRMAPLKSRSSQHQYRPSAHSCTVASPANFLLRAAAKRSRNRLSQTKRHRDRAWYKKLNSRKSISPQKWRAIE